MRTCFYLFADRFCPSRFQEPQVSIFWELKVRIIGEYHVLGGNGWPPDEYFVFPQVDLMTAALKDDRSPENRANCSFGVGLKGSSSISESSQWFRYVVLPNIHTPEVGLSGIDSVWISPSIKALHLSEFEPTLRGLPRILLRGLSFGRWKVHRSLLGLDFSIAR